MRFDLVAHLHRQIMASKKNFGPDTSDEKLGGILSHINKELTEIAEDPRDLIEWIDVVILAFDGAWRAGYTPDQIVEALVLKQKTNESRKWPDWRTIPAGEPIEHDRYEDGTNGRDRTE